MGDFTNLNIKDSADIGLVGDHRGLDRLRRLAQGDKKDEAKALVAAASQFESLLNQFWMDAMRETNDTINPDSPLHSKYSSFFEDMLSNQMVSASVTQKGHINKNSITYLITKQFAKSLGDEGKEILKEIEGGSLSSTKEVTLSGAFVKGKSYSRALDDCKASVHALKEMYDKLESGESMRHFESQEDFVDKMMPYALKAVANVGMNPLVLVAQAALETGWGKHVPSNNNFYGIKAGSFWQGEVQNLSSGEYENGEYVDRVSAFRAYPSVLESMQDYVKLITGNERYEKASKVSFDPDKYFDEIQKAGYATDPNYASKLKNIVRKIAFMAYK